MLWCIWQSLPQKGTLSHPPGRGARERGNSPGVFIGTWKVMWNLNVTFNNPRTLFLTRLHMTDITLVPLQKVFPLILPGSVTAFQPTLEKKLRKNVIHPIKIRFGDGIPPNSSHRKEPLVSLYIYFSLFARTAGFPLNSQILFVPLYCFLSCSMFSDNDGVNPH